MSNAVSALQGASYTGYVEVEEMGLRGMITLRGDLSDARLKAAVKAAVGVAVPDVTRCALSETGGAAWMSPDELLLFCTHDDAPARAARLSADLAGTHFLAANVSDARAVFQLRGTSVREVIAKLAPVDMSPEAFPLGHFRRSRIAQTPAAFFMRDETTLELICFRSVADYVFELFKRAAMPGSAVNT